MFCVVMYSDGDVIRAHLVNNWESDSAMAVLDSQIKEDGELSMVYRLGLDWICATRSIHTHIYIFYCTVYIHIRLSISH